MKLLSIVATLLSAASVTLSPFAIAEKLTPTEQEYVGGYKHGTVDTIMRLVLLDDRTFCVSFTGGALDYLGAGHWKADASGGITLREAKPDHPEFVAFADNKKLGTVAFHFDGYSMSNAESAIFATSDTNVVPSTFRPLFPDGQNTWKDSYQLPAIKADKATYFFVGFAELDQYRKPTRFKVIQYKASDSALIRIGFNQTQTMSMMNTSGKLTGNVLKLDGETFGRKDVLPPEVMQDVKQNCVDQVLHADPAAASDEDGRIPTGSTLTPVKVFYVPLKAMRGKPFFATAQ